MMMMMMMLRAAMIISGARGPPGKPGATGATGPVNAIQNTRTTPIPSLCEGPVGKQCYFSYNFSEYYVAHSSTEIAFPSVYMSVCLSRK